MSETAILIQTAQEKYNQGFNCAESVAASFASTYPQKISSQLVPLASAFGASLTSAGAFTSSAGFTGSAFVSVFLASAFAARRMLSLPTDIIHYLPG